MATLDELTPSIAAHAPDAPGPVIQRFLLDAAREFCRGSTFWREDLGLLDIYADEPTFAMALPAKSKVVDVISVTYNGVNDVVPKTPKQLDVLQPGWRTLTGSVPKYYYRSGVADVRIIPMIGAIASEIVQVTVALMPALDATTIDDKIADDYTDALTYGTLARVFRVPKKDWTDFKLAEYYRAMFQDMIDQAKSRADAARGLGVVRVSKYGGY